MKFKNIKPNIELEPFIHSYWELKGNEYDKQWERNFPDGCAGLVMNLGDICLTDNGTVSIEFGKSYMVGAMNSFKDSFIDNNTHLIGVCLKPASITNFYSYAPQIEFTNKTIELEKSNSFNIDKILRNPTNYFNQFYIDRLNNNNIQLQSALQDIAISKGQLAIYDVAKRNSISLRQLERDFKIHIGLSPKEYSNIVRFQYALSVIKHSDKKRSLLDISFECGYYDHSHLANEIKKHTGLSPSQL
ncbi:helix-turn-helix transcriptional regulator [Mariniflexile litorale]|uniref:Helix-turn-helix transcriptional regulator n=1 Tax=Mariniflexile litorale TaxID=3045158 RepID=A0AAU7EFU5_9FLAO|nr:helix-turn-helix transcriptional regulator [Mariniflexile sp. KMM 9835]MDQ8212006.1 helix-turn-helix transcriptional regulator [Mariniflexile sp. KMM 9835]